MKSSSYRRIEVEWEDAIAQPGWVTIDDAADWASRSTIIISVGIELVNDKQYIVLALSAAPNKLGELLKIPKSLVRKVKILR